MSPWFHRVFRTEHRYGNPDRRKSGVIARPFDFYIALLVFIAAIAGFFDPNWPEKYDFPIEQILYFEDVYLTIASAAIMFALIMKQFRKLPVSSIILEMGGWMFVSAGSAMIVLSSYWVPIAIVDPEGQLNAIWLVFWGGLSVTSCVRWLDLRVRYHNPHMSDVND